MARKKIGYRWHLRRLMADRDMYATTDLRPLLADRGVVLSREQVYRLVTRVPERLSLQTLAVLCDILDCQPGDLVEPVAGRLAAELAARGSATVAVPACTVCGRSGKPLFRGDGGGVCQRCRAWQVARPCATCGKVKPAAGFEEDGRAVCEVCRRRDDPRRHRQCGRCGKTAPIAARARDGHPDICVNCYRMPSAT